MNQLENISAKGALSVVLTDAQGKVKDTREFKNLVVTTGLNFIVSRMKDATATAMSHMELGTGATAAAAGDTTLGAAIASSRTALTSTTVSTNTITYVASFAAGTGTGAVTESGIFNASSAGTMLCRTVFPVVNKQSGDSMTVTWTITVS
jgi:hypothetical protein